MTVEHSALAFASANGITIAYDTFGSPEQEPLVLIMGLSSQMILWEEDFCTRLAARGFFVIRFDNRDVGLSTRFSRAGMPHIHALLSGKIRGASAVPYTIADMALDAVGLLDALGVKSAHVVGESMGGMIGQEMAIRYPERTRTLASIMSTTGNPLLPPPRQEALEILFRPVPLDREGFVRYFREVWTILSGPRYSMDDERALHLGHETFSRGIEPAGSARQFAAIIASGSRKERLSRVTAPSLVMHGDLDPLVPLECGIDTAEAIPGAQLMVMEGMGHYLPPQLWGEIIDAIAGNAARHGHP
jgi:pimeloyl-ACP methyl ester carboxylesterase